MPTTGSPQARSRAGDLLDGARPWFEPLLLVLTLVALASGAVTWLAGNSDLADACWIAGTIAGLVPAVGWVLTALVHKRTGVDLIAVLALAGAEWRASHDLCALLERAPSTARRRVGTEVSRSCSAPRPLPAWALVSGSDEFARRILRRRAARIPAAV